MAKEYSVKMSNSKLDISEEKSQDNKKGKGGNNNNDNNKGNFSSLDGLGGGKQNTVKIEVPPKTIITILLVVLGIYLLFQLFYVFIIFFFAFVLASATLPLITSLINKGLPRWLSIIVVYLLFLTLLGAIVTLIITPFVSETDSFVKEINKATEQSLENLKDYQFEFLGAYGEDLQRSLVDYIDNFSAEMVPALLGSADAFSTAVDAVMGFGGAIVIIATIIIISVYIVADHDRVVDAVLLRISGDEKRDRIRKLIVDVEHKLGRWLIGQGTVSLVIGCITWIILTIFNVPFALPLALAAALLEVVPNLGPVLVSIPIVLISLLTQGPLIAVLVVLCYIILQQFQSYFLTPRIMGGVIGLHPLLVFVGMITGFTLAGLLGAVLAVPTLVLLRIAYEFYKDLQKLKAKGIL